MEEYWDFYLYWDMIHNTSDNEDGEEYTEEDLEEFFEAPGSSDDCDGWCEWEYSDWNNWDDEWDDETKEQYWISKSIITGCDGELICEFLECNNAEAVEGDGECWSESCESECG